jgi:hypothetical protein
MSKCEEKIKYWSTNPYQDTPKSTAFAIYEFTRCTKVLFWELMKPIEKLIDKVLG